MTPLPAADADCLLSGSVKKKVPHKTKEKPPKTSLTPVPLALVLHLPSPPPWL